MEPSSPLAEFLTYALPFCRPNRLRGRFTDSFITPFFSSHSNYFLVIEAGIFVRSALSQPPPFHRPLTLPPSPSLNSPPPPLSRSIISQGTYYFNGPGSPSVAWGAFKRASTYSMGSIAFGSLIVALLDLLRTALQVLQQYEQGQGDTIGAAIACCAQCCVGCIASLAEYFNRYAMIECVDLRGVEWLVEWLKLTLDDRPFAESLSTENLTSKPPRILGTFSKTEESMLLSTIVSSTTCVLPSLFPSRSASLTPPLPRARRSGPSVLSPLVDSVALSRSFTSRFRILVMFKRMVTSRRPSWDT